MSRNLDWIMNMTENKRKTLCSEVLSTITSREINLSVGDVSLSASELKEFVRWLNKESSVFPVLSEEEKEAVNILISCGYTHLWRARSCLAGNGKLFGGEWTDIKEIPMAKCLDKATWITEDMLSLSSLVPVGSVLYGEEQRGH